MKVFNIVFIDSYFEKVFRIKRANRISQEKTPKLNEKRDDFRQGKWRRTSLDTEGAIIR